MLIKFIVCIYNLNVLNDIKLYLKCFVMYNTNDDLYQLSPIYNV